MEWKFNTKVESKIFKKCYQEKYKIKNFINLAFKNKTNKYHNLDNKFLT
jgi:hypothetical protein